MVSEETPGVKNVRFDSAGLWIDGVMVAPAHYMATVMAGTGAVSGPPGPIGTPGASARTKVFRDPVMPPSSGHTAGDIWINTSTGVTSILSSTGAWEEIAMAPTTGTITGGSFTTGGTKMTGPFSAGGIVTPATSTSKILGTPTKRPKKVLIAFLGDDDEVEWAAKLHPGDMEIRLDASSVPTMTLELPMIDAE